MRVTDCSEGTITEPSQKSEKRNKNKVEEESL